MGLETKDQEPHDEGAGDPRSPAPCRPRRRPIKPGPNPPASYQRRYVYPGTSAR